MTDPEPDTRPDPVQAIAQLFDSHRGRLVAVAFRMLGSPTDAEDAVQEAWLRLSRQDAATIHNLSGWLTTVVGRVCIDMLRSRKAHPELSFGHELPELVITADSATAPEEDALLADSVGVAMLVVLETLGPAERLAFVLHDMFAVSFSDIGKILGRSTDAAKMLASRARRKVQGTDPIAPETAQPRAVIDAFLAAARHGDFNSLLQLLDPEVVWRTHTPRGVVVRLGATEVASRALQGSSARGTAQPVLINGEPGIVAWGETGRPLGVMACTVVDGRITGILSVIDPARIAALDLPEWQAS